MVIEPPDFDADLFGHSAVTLKEEDNEVCHAVVSKYRDGEPNDSTECGKEVDKPAYECKPRKEFVGEDVEMCSECWPNSITDE